MVNGLMDLCSPTDALVSIPSQRGLFGMLLWALQNGNTHFLGWVPSIPRQGCWLFMMRLHEFRVDDFDVFEMPSCSLSCLLNELFVTKILLSRR